MKLVSLMIISYVSVILDREYSNKNDENEFFINEDFYIRRILNIFFISIQLLKQLAFTREELKINYFKR